MKEAGLGRDLLAVAALAAAVGGCFHVFALTGTFAIADDTRAIHYPVLAGVFGQLANGRLPTWFPEILLGYPGAGSVEFHLFSPFHWAFLLFPPGLAIGLRFVTIHLVSALSMYALGRQLEMSRAGALLAGLAWALGPPAVFMLIEPMASATVPWFPLVLLCWDRACRGRAAAWFVGTGAVLGVALLGGHLQHAFWFGAFLAAYPVVVVAPELPREARLRQLAVIGAGGGAALVLALAVGAIELLPSIELFRDSIRVALDAHERLPREQPAWLEVPRLLGATAFSVEKPRFSLEYARVGLVPLGLALLALGRGRRSATRLFALGSVFLLLALGDAFPPSNWLLRALPGNRFRFAERIGLVFSFVTVILAGRGVDVLLAGERAWRRLAALAALALLVGAPLVASTELVRRQEVLVGLLGLALLTAGTAAASGRGRAVGLALALLAMLSWSARNVDAVMGMEDAVRIGSRMPAPIPAWLGELPKADENGPTRLLCLACGRGNEVMFTGHQTPTGYVTLRPDRVERLVYGRRRVSDPEQPLEATLGRRQPLLDLLGIRHVVAAGAPAERFEAAQLERSLTQVGTRDGLTILENRTRLPRSFFISRAVGVPDAESAWARVTDPAFDPRRELLLEGPVRALAGPEGVAFVPARVTHYEPGRVDVAVAAPAAGFVVLVDRWAEGWDCELNGRPAPILLADYLFRAVAVETGQSVLRFRYRDATLARAAWISVLALAASLVVLIAATARAGGILRRG